MQPLMMITRDHDQLGLDGGPVTARRIDLEPPVGTWVNVEAHASGISRVEITERDGALVVRVLVAGGPEPVDWGEAVAEVFGDGLTSQAAVGFVARYHFGSRNVLLDAYVNGRRLVVEAFSTFTGSGRRSGHLRRAHLTVL